MSRIQYNCQLLGMQILMLSAVLLSIGSLLFFVGIPITAFHFIFALIIAIGVCWLLLKKFKTLTPPEVFKKSDFLLTSSLSILLILSFFFISAYVVDISPVNRTLHRPGIEALATGWNPTHQPFIDKFAVSLLQSGEENKLLFDNYPKGTWIIAASVYKLSGIYEGGKLFNFLFLLAAFLVTFNFLSHFQRVPDITKGIIAVLVALNPVALYRLFSYSNDCQFTSMVTIVIILAFHYIMFRERKIIFFLFLAVLNLANIKFAGLLYGIVVIVLAWLTVFVIDRDFQKRYIIGMLIGVIAAVVFIGFQPYMTNWIYKGNPFYPALGNDDQLELPESLQMVKQAPREFIQKDRFRKLFYSVFSQAEDRKDQMPRLKLPFSIGATEMGAFNRGEVRYGGFGPLFGSVLFFIVVALVLVLILIKARKLVLLFTFIPAAVLLISVLLNPQAWWAKLAPQLWLLPITFIITFYYIGREEKMNYIRGFALSILLLNSLSVLAGYTVSNLQMNGKGQQKRVSIEQKTDNISISQNKKALE